MKVSHILAPVIAALAIGSVSAQDAEAPKRERGERPAQRPQPDAIAKRLIHAHDKDGDKKLNEAELTEALKALHGRRGGGERRGQRPQGGAPAAE